MGGVALMCSDVQGYTCLGGNTAGHTAAPVSSEAEKNSCVVSSQIKKSVCGLYHQIKKQPLAYVSGDIAVIGYALGDFFPL